MIRNMPMFAVSWKGYDYDWNEKTVLCSADHSVIGRVGSPRPLLSPLGASDFLAPQSGRGLSVEGSWAARLNLDLILTPVLIPSLYKGWKDFETADPFSESSVLRQDYTKDDALFSKIALLIIISPEPTSIFFIASSCVLRSTRA